MANAYIRKLDVLNRGYSGYNTDWCLHVLPHLIEELGRLKNYGAEDKEEVVELFIIFLGANDAVLPGERQHVPLARYVENIKQLAMQAKSISKHQLIICPPPVHVTDWAKHRLNQGRHCDRSAEHTEKYAVECLKAAKELNVPAVDLFTAFNDLKQSHEMQKLFCDGLHFSQTGNQILFEAIQRVIKEQLPEIMPEYVRTNYPWHDIVDITDLTNSIRP